MHGLEILAHARQNERQLFQEPRYVLVQCSRHEHQTVDSLNKTWEVPCSCISTLELPCVSTSQWSILTCKLAEWYMSKILRYLCCVDRKVTYSLPYLTIFWVFYNVVHPIQWSSKTVLLWWAEETNQGAYSWWSLWSLFSVLTDSSSKYCYDIPPSTRHYSIHTMLQIRCNFMYNLLFLPSISWEWMSVQPTTTRYFLLCI